MSSTTTNDAPSFNVKASDWDRASESYAQLASKGSPMSVPITKLIEMLHTFLPFDSATTILDIGCGPGNATAQLISTHHAAIPASTQLLATDFSSGMLKLASEVRTANLSVTQGTEKDAWARVVPLVLDAADLRPLLSGSVSHIIANFVLFMIENPAKALREAHRVLKSDGVAACSSWSNKMDWIEYFGLAASRTFPAIGKPLPQRPTFAAQWTSVEGVGALFTDAGFRDIHTEYVEAPIVVHSVEGFAHHFLTSGNPAVTWATDVLDETEVEQLERQLVQVIKEKSKVENGAYVLGGTAVLAIGRK